MYLLSLVICLGDKNVGDKSCTHSIILDVTNVGYEAIDLTFWFNFFVLKMIKVSLVFLGCFNVVKKGVEKQNIVQGPY